MVRSADKNHSSSVRAEVEAMMKAYNKKNNL